MGANDIRSGGIDLFMLFVIGMACLMASLWQELTIYVFALQDDEDAIFYIVLTLVKLIGVFFVALYGWPRVE